MMIRSLSATGGLSLVSLGSPRLPHFARSAIVLSGRKSDTVAGKSRMGQARSSESTAIYSGAIPWGRPKTQAQDPILGLVHMVVDCEGNPSSKTP
jgi:hypothetical protein